MADLWFGDWDVDAWLGDKNCIDYRGRCGFCRIFWVEDQRTEIVYL